MDYILFRAAFTREKSEARQILADMRAFARANRLMSDSARVMIQETQAILLSAD